jgi:hypothetical protein
VPKAEQAAGTTPFMYAAQFRDEGLQHCDRDRIERELDSEADAMQMKVGADGKCVLVKATEEVEINDMMQYSQTAQKFTQYAAQTGAVKFLHPVPKCRGNIFLSKNIK